MAIDAQSSLMRVLHVVWSLEVGGLEKVTVDLCNALTDRGVFVSVAALSTRGALATQLVDGIDVWEGGVHLKARIGGWRVLWGLVRFARQHEVRLIHAHNPKALQYALLLRWVTRLPLVFTQHGRGSAE